MNHEINIREMQRPNWGLHSPNIECTISHCSYSPKPQSSTAPSDYRQSALYFLDHVRQLKCHFENSQSLLFFHFFICLLGRYKYLRKFNRFH